MYERFAKDLSADLFNSIWDDLFAMASRDNEARYKAAKRKKDYRHGEAQDALNDFCFGRASLGNTLDFINSSKARGLI